MAASMIAQAQSGDVKAFLALAPFLFGSPTQRQEHTGPQGAPIAFTLKLGDTEPFDLDVSET
ncbi:MAG: hypothetical protein NVS2B7_29010 [Herpetosiphon sp.]